MAGPEINVTFRYNPKKVRRAWGISQVIMDLILNWFLKNTHTLVYFSPKTILAS
jgi:hypothetical protein